MKIKYILSFAILLSISFFDLQLALADGNDFYEGICIPGEIPVVDSNNKTVCEKDGVGYCRKKGLEYDKQTMSCYKSGQGTILPFTHLTVEQCNNVFNDISLNPGSFKIMFEGGVEGTGGDGVSGEDLSVNTLPVSGVGEVSAVDVLGCGIKTGKMKLWMIPYYIKYLLQFVLSVAGIVAVGAMVFGGYLYMFGTVMDDKEKGKRSVMYGIMGFVVVLLAWAIVNVVISLATM